MEEVIGFDVEATSIPRHVPWAEGSYIVSASVINTKGDTQSWLINHPESTQSQRSSIDELTERLYKAKRIVGHNIKFDCLWLLHLGIDINPLRLYCTQVAEYLLRNQRVARGELTLAQLSKDYGISDKIDRVKTFWESGYETDEIPASILVPYCEQDTINTLAIYQRQVKKIIHANLVPLCTLQCEMSKVLSQVEYNGLYLNKEALENYAREYGEKIADLDRQITDIIKCKAGVGEVSFNLGSDYDLSAILYGGRIKWDGEETVRKLRKDGTYREYTRKCVHEVYCEGLGFKGDSSLQTSREGVFKTDMETLKNLKCKESYQREFIRCIIERSKLTKLKSTYFDGLLNKMEKDNRIHPSMNQCITRTGRLSSSNPKQIGVIKPCEFRGTPYRSILSEANTYLLVRRTRWNSMFVIM